MKLGTLIGIVITFNMVQALPICTDFPDEGRSMNKVWMQNNEESDGRHGR